MTENLERMVELNTHVYNTEEVNLKCGTEEGGIVTSCSGRTHFRMDLANVKGQAKIPDVIAALYQKVLAWQKLSKPDADISVSATALEARTLYGPAPDYATVSLIARFKDPAQGEELDGQIRRIARSNVRNLRVQVTKEVDRQPVIETDAVRGFFQLAQKQAERLHIRVQPTHRPVSSDICYIPGSTPALDGMGPLGGEYRSPAEYILRDSLIDRVRIEDLNTRFEAALHRFFVNS